MKLRHRLVVAASAIPVACAPAPRPTAEISAPRRQDVEPLPAVGAGEESPPTNVATGQGPTTTTVAVATTSTTAPLVVVEPFVAPHPLPERAGPVDDIEWWAAQPGFASTFPTGRCGGDLPPCWVMDRESGGDPTAVSPPGYCVSGDTRCRGKWQFDGGSWAGYGGYALADQAPEQVQDEKARLMWAGGQGCSHWAACR